VSFRCLTPESGSCVALTVAVVVRCINFAFGLVSSKMQFREFRGQRVGVSETTFFELQGRLLWHFRFGCPVKEVHFPLAGLPFPAHL